MAEDRAAWDKVLVAARAEEVKERAAWAGHQPPDPAATVSARNAGRESHISAGYPALSRNARNVVRQWQENNKP